MTQIDFYVLPDSGANARERLACRLAEKAFKLGHTVYVHAGSAAQAGALDDLMWTYRAGSFLPHARADQKDAATTPIVLGYGEEPAGSDDVLVNLDHAVPAFFSRFKRVMEILDQQEDTLTRGRERYRYYQERGYALESHKLKG